MNSKRSVGVAIVVGLVTAGQAWAQGEAPAGEPAPTDPTAGAVPTSFPTDMAAPTGQPSDQPSDQPEQPAEKKKQPHRGDFDAGGQVRFPSGPDEMGEYASFNWVAVDAIGTYYLLDTVTVAGKAPLAIIHPDTLPGGAEPKMFGGMDVTLRAALPRSRFQPKQYKTDLALTLSGTYSHFGAMLLGPKDFPLFIGDFEPGLSGGVEARVKLSSLIDFVTTPKFVYQHGADESLTGVQLPMAAVVGLGDVVKVSADLAINTGDDYAFSADEGGRIAAGGSLTVKLGPIMTHAGAGTASLLTGGLYPTIKDGFYVDLDVKYVK